MYHFSVLDLSPIPEGSNAAVALTNSLDLAQEAEKLGYNPTIWDENVELMIKLLSDPNYYRKPPVKYGAYRGPAKTYVKSIYSRYMSWRENE